MNSERDHHTNVAKGVMITLLPMFMAGAALADSIALESGKKAMPHGSMSTGDAGMPSGHPPAIPSDNNMVNRGKVLEVIDSSMYTYVKVSTPKGSTWLAAYKTAVSKGANVRYSSGMAMTDFHSKAIDRTFDSIIFVDSLEVVK